MYCILKLFGKTLHGFAGELREGVASSSAELFFLRYPYRRLRNSAKLPNDDDNETDVSEFDVRHVTRSGNKCWEEENDRVQHIFYQKKDKKTRRWITKQDTRRWMSPPRTRTVGTLAREASAGKKCDNHVSIFEREMGGRDVGCQLNKPYRSAQWPFKGKFTRSRPILNDSQQKHPSRRPPMIYRDISPDDNHHQPPSSSGRRPRGLDRMNKAFDEHQPRDWETTNKDGRKVDGRPRKATEKQKKEAIRLMNARYALMNVRTTPTYENEIRTFTEFYRRKGPLPVLRPVLVRQNTDSDTDHSDS